MACFMLILTWGGIIFVDILHQVLLLLCQTTLASRTLNMVAIIKNRNFFNCLLLLYYKSKWAQILCIYMALSSTAYLPFFFCDFFFSQLILIVHIIERKNCIKIFGIAVKISLNGKKQNWKNRLKFRNQIENQENDYRLQGASSFLIRPVKTRFSFSQLFYFTMKTATSYHLN